MVIVSDATRRLAPACRSLLGATCSSRKGDAEHLDGIVRNLLAMTRVEAGAWDQP